MLNTAKAGLFNTAYTEQLSTGVDALTAGGLQGGKKAGKQKVTRKHITDLIGICVNENENKPSEVIALIEQYISRENLL